MKAKEEELEAPKRPDSLTLQQNEGVAGGRASETRGAGDQSSVDSERIPVDLAERDAIIEQKLRELDLHPEDDSSECGLAGCRPQSCESTANIKMFVLVMSILVVFNSMLGSGYVNAVLTTIEKRFSIGSTISGWIVAMNDVGALISFLIIPYMGSSRHVPRFIAAGACCIAVGSATFALPHFIAPTYTVQENGLSNNSVESQICLPTIRSSKNDAECIDPTSGNIKYVLIIVAAQVLIGWGGTPIMTLGTNYVDKHVSIEKSPLYISPLYACSAIGLALGYGLGAACMQMYVDFFVDIDSSDPRFIGAWWLGFLVIGFLLASVSIPLFSFPRQLRKDRRQMVVALLQRKYEVKEEQDPQQPNRVEELSPEEELRIAVNESNYGKSIKDLPRCVWRLLKNKVFILMTLAVTCNLAIIAGLTSFLPKYLEKQYNVGSDQASLLTGGVLVPGAALGTFAGGIIMRKYQLHSKGALLLTIILNIATFSGFFILFFLGCKNLPFAGATMSYSTLYTTNTTALPFQANLTSQCNSRCKCSNNQLEPICGADHVTYFSPCHAGCTISYKDVNATDTGGSFKILNYANCSCILHARESTPLSTITVSHVAVSGPCKNNCPYLPYFLMVLFVMGFLLSSTLMPVLSITMRAVSSEERAFALALQFIVIRLFGNIPAPLLFGKLIDSSCILWNRKCERDGFCLIYDVINFRMKHTGLSGGLHLLNIIFLCATYVMMKVSDKRHKSRQRPLEELREHLGGTAVSLVSITTPSEPTRNPHSCTSTPGSIDAQTSNRVNDLPLPGPYSNLMPTGGAEFLLDMLEEHPEEAEQTPDLSESQATSSFGYSNAAFTADSQASLVNLQEESSCQAAL